MLNKIRDLSMPLLSVHPVGDDNTLILGKEKKMTTYRKTAIIVGVLYIALPSAATKPFLLKTV